MSHANGHDEASAFLPDEYFEDGLTELEQRAALERTGRVAANIEIDIQDKGPLYHYIIERRTEALQALQDLVRADPRDGIAIGILQASVKEYLKVCDHIHRAIESADVAENIIKEQYNPNEHDDEPSEQHPV